MTDRAHWAKMLPIIQAFVEGKEIEVNIADEWTTATAPGFFCEPDAYRIKLEPIVISINTAVVPSGKGWYAIQKTDAPNLRLTYDPETHALLTAEVIR